MKDKHGNPVPLYKLIDVPPAWLAATLLLQYGLHRYVPVLPCPSSASAIAGAAVMIAGFGLIFWSARGFFRADTPIHPRRKPNTLLTDGPYAISRNPIYLGMAVISCGFALALGSMLPLTLPFVFALIIQSRFIAGEEYHIERQFGQDWRDYTAKVRRWF